jgi:HK97 family phage portal protein
MWPFSKRQETRDNAVIDLLAQAYGFRLSGAVAPHTAENLSGCLACINLIATGLASLPIRVYRNDQGERIEVPSHPVAQLLRRPNAYQDFGSWLELCMGSTLLFGNGLSVLSYDNRGVVTEMLPVPWTSVVPRLLPMPSRRMVFDVMLPTLFSPAGPPVRYLDSEICLFRDRGDLPFIGRSRLSRAPSVIGNAASLQDYSSNFFSSGMAPSASLTHPKTLSDGARKRLKSDMDNRRGATDRSVLILEEGLTYAQMNISPDAAELLASRKWSTQELARLWGVPNALIGADDRATLQSTKEAALWFAKFCLAGWARKVESELERVLLPADGSMAIAFDLMQLQRGDPEAQMASAVQALASGLLTANELRQQLGYPQHPDGNKLRRLPGEPIGAGSPLMGDMPNAGQSE